MNNFSFAQFMLKVICILAIQQSIAANSKGCNTPKLGPSAKLVFTIFDSDYKLTRKIWESLCGAIKKFPQGLVTAEYKPGALATGTVTNIKCGGGNCENDQLRACILLHSKNYESCYDYTEYAYSDVLMCYCSQGANKFLLDNAALRASWSIPDKAVPTLGVNKTYDSCVKFGSEQEVLQYLCAVYQNRVGPCG